jgi:uncharacterized surface protein with fasciclin (FAS1) repeats
MYNQNFKFFTTKITWKKWALPLALASLTSLISIDAFAKPIYPPYALFQPYAYRRYPYRSFKGKIADSLARDSKFKNLVDELKQTDQLKILQEDCLQKEPNCLTIFAPTDKAFAALSEEQFKKISQPENLVKVLKYHIVQGVVSEEDVKGKTKVTMEGSTVQITDTANGSYKINDANAKHPSTVASNGVIIEIDKVLLPQGF